MRRPCPVSPARARRRLWSFMAGKTGVTPQTHEALEREGHEATPDRPLLDLSDGAVKNLIRSANERGYVTHEQINLLSKELNSEQIEDVLATFNEMGINLIESEETPPDDGQREEVGDEAEAESGELVGVAQ